MYQSTLAHKLFCLYSVKSKPALEILISKLMFKMDFSVSVYAVNSRKSDAVKGVVFAGSVNGHIAEHQQISHVGNGVHAVIPDDIPGQAGRPGKAYRAGLFTGFLCAQQRRAVGHLNDIRHMAGGAGIQNRNCGIAVLHYIQYAG